jgi:hypothetical protein
VDLVLDRPWGTDAPQNRIVAIAHRSTLDSDSLNRLFDACAAPVDTRPAPTEQAAVSR